MIFTETKLQGVTIVDIQRLQDERGFFARSWCRNEFKQAGLVDTLVQTNISFNAKKGIIRGMHFQLPPFEEVKLVQCTRGAIFDVIVDLRPQSKTHKQWISVELTEENHRMIYIPPGCGHGYQTLTDTSDILYQVSQFYSQEHARGARYNDPAFQIQWPLPLTLISKNDSTWPDYTL
jgi:dTDP-4-dehydrorhamnose 3,5-epimerase